MPVFLVLAYGVGRILMMVLAQIRDVLFTAVATHAVRELAGRTFSHIHRLSLRFHMERRTGALSRVVERGMEAVDTILRMGVMNAAPTVLEDFLLVSGVLLYYFGIELRRHRDGDDRRLCLVHRQGERVAARHPP